MRVAMMSTGIPTDRYTGPQSQLFKKRQYDEKPLVANEMPTKLPRTGIFLR